MGVSNSAKSTAGAAMANLFSQDCQLCGALAPALLCGACLRDLPRREDAGCPCCGEAGSDSQRCGACLAEPPGFDTTISAFRYEFPLDRLLQAYKFRAHLALTGMLADSLAAAVERHLAGGDYLLPDLLVPMPLSRQRLAERGFNQSALLAQLLATRFQRRLESNVLLRVRHTPPQAGLKRSERQKNVKNAFACEPGEVDVRGLRVALIDDVMTTGASMSEAARALKKAGARQVEAWALARALQHH